MDPFSKAKRSEIMRLVRSRNTQPEKTVRSLLHALGFRFRLYRRDLPGNPDIVLPKYRTVVFVHGCFWHRHRRCKEASTPATSLDYWLPKFSRTVERDKRNRAKLQRLGWKVVVIWECQITKREKLESLLKKALCRK